MVYKQVDDEQVRTVFTMVLRVSLLWEVKVALDLTAVLVSDLSEGVKM